MRVAALTVGDSAITGTENGLWVVSSGPSSACNGDSGGPLVNADGRLAGIISSTAGCASNQPNFAANVAEAEIRDFLTGNDHPAAAPRGGTDADLSSNGDARPAATLTCSPGTWSGTPTYAFSFVDTATGAVLQSGPSSTYGVTGTDADRTIGCDVTATNAGGTGHAQAAHALGIGPTPVAAPTHAVPQSAGAGIAPALFFGAPRQKRGLTRVPLGIAGAPTTSATVTGARWCIHIRGAVLEPGGRRQRCSAFAPFTAPASSVVIITLRVISRSGGRVPVRIALTVTLPGTGTETVSATRRIAVLPARRPSQHHRPSSHHRTGNRHHTTHSS